jgi:hypothetical protein
VPISIQGLLPGVRVRWQLLGGEQPAVVLGIGRHQGGSAKRRVPQQQFGQGQLVGRQSGCEGVRPEELVGGSRRALVSRVRVGIAYVWLEWFGRSGPRIAPLLGFGVPAVYRVAQHGRQQAEYWQRLVNA